jgi:chromatin segregation and condensation protein Rec8/ScpA/Scc1 (kleisin family)
MSDEIEGIFARAEQLLARKDAEIARLRTELAANQKLAAALSDEHEEVERLTAELAASQQLAAALSDEHEEANLYDALTRIRDALQRVAVSVKASA